MTIEKELDDIEILENLKNRIYQAIVNNEPPPKVGELLKVIEMKKKMSVEGQAEKKFWDLINRIRTEELGKGRRKKISTKKQTK